MYAPIDVRLELLGEAVKRLAALGFAGFDVMVQHKQAMLALVDELDETASLAGAANTVVVGEGRLRTTDTDGSGFVEACEEAGVVREGQRVLILGVGGATSFTIAVAVLNKVVSRLYIADQTTDEAEEPCVKLSEAATEADTLGCCLEEADDVAAEAGVIINAIYMGIKKEGPLPLPAEALTMDKIICKAGEETALIRRARAAGTRTVAGCRCCCIRGCGGCVLVGNPAWR